MRTRTFLGLIILVAALMVASIPALLAPTARGVEHLAVEAGMLEDPVAIEKQRRKEQAKREAARGASGDVEDSLEIKGFTVEEDGDLRDTKTNGARDSNERGRLEAGASRALMPGQRPGTDAYSPPFASQDGVLLDIDGCPVFRPEADVAALMANTESEQRYADKVASADDPADCRTIFAERIAIATGTDDPDVVRGAAGRQLAGLQYESFESMGITMHEYDMLVDIFDFDGLPEVVAPATGAAAAAKTTTSAATATTTK